MRASLFCVLFALLQNTHQAFLQIHRTKDTPSDMSLRSLELDTETTFPIIEAVKIQLGEWTFWVTLFMFAGVVFMAWKENCLGKWERTGAYTIFVGLIFFSYYTIPFILGLGIYCFRDYLFKNRGLNPIHQFTGNEVELREDLLSEKDRRLQTSSNFLGNTTPNSQQNGVNVNKQRDLKSSNNSFPERNPFDETNKTASPGKSKPWYLKVFSWSINGIKTAAKNPKLKTAVKGQLNNVIQSNMELSNIVKDKAAKLKDNFEERVHGFALPDPTGLVGVNTTFEDKPVDPHDFDLEIRQNIFWNRPLNNKDHHVITNSSGRRMITVKKRPVVVDNSFDYPT